MTSLIQPNSMATPPAAAQTAPAGHTPMRFGAEDKKDAFDPGKKKKSSEGKKNNGKRGILDYVKATGKAFVNDGLSMRGLIGDSIGVGLVGMAALIVPGFQLALPFIPFWYLVGAMFRTVGNIGQYLPAKTG